LNNTPHRKCLILIEGQFWFHWSHNSPISFISILFVFVLICLDVDATTPSKDKIAGYRTFFPKLYWVHVTWIWYHCSVCLPNHALQPQILFWFCCLFEVMESHCLDFSMFWMEWSHPQKVVSFSWQQIIMTLFILLWFDLVHHSQTP
jgi:hypothetical protein